MFRLKIVAIFTSTLLFISQFGSAQPFQFGAFTDALFGLQQGELCADIVVNFPFGDQPSAETELYFDNETLKSILVNNLDYLAEQGFTRVSFAVIEGSGLYYANIPILENARHEDFDYNAQLVDPSDPESELIDSLVEREALKRYVFAGDLAGVFVSETQKRDMIAELNLESLAHIVNRANASGIGGSGDEIIIADNLPPLSPEEIALFLEQLKDAVVTHDPTIETFTIFEEAFDDRYVQAISETASRLGLAHRRAGPSPDGYGDEWAAYHYAFYPMSKLQEQIYRYLITIASTPAVEAITVGAARAANKASQVVVGHYTPWPSDLSLGIEDLWNPNNAVPIDANFPSIETRTSGLQSNFILFSFISEHVDEFFVATDLDSALQDFLTLSIQDNWLTRLNHFSDVLNEERPKINVIIDFAEDIGNDLAEGNEISDFSDQMPFVVQFSMIEPVMAAILAAGFEPWVTYNQPIQGRDDIEAYWIVSAGGGELIETDQIAESPPLWTQGDDLDSTLLALLDPNVTAEPVFLSVMAGIPNTGGWLNVRKLFSLSPGRGGTPDGLQYASTNLIALEEYQTSLATNILVNPEGEPYEDELGQLLTAPLLPETIDWEGRPVRLRGVDPAQFGVFVNVISPDEIPSENIVIASTRTDGSDSIQINHVDSADSQVQTKNRASVFVLRNGAEGNKFLVTPNTYHVDMAYPLSNILSDAAGIDRTLNAPVSAYVAGGTTKAVFAIEDGVIDLTMTGPLRINRFSPHGEWTIQDQIETSENVFPISVQRHELVIVSPVNESDVNHWALY